MSLQPHAPFPLVLQLQGKGSKSWDDRLTVSFTDKSPWKISLMLVNQWRDMDTLNHWRSNLSLKLWWLIGLVQIRFWGVQHNITLFSSSSVRLLEWPQACLRALASSWWCSCLVCVGFFLVTGPVCCRAWKCWEQILSGGSFLFVSVIVVSSDSLLQTPEGMTLKQALVWMLSAFKQFSCQVGLRCTQNCRSPLLAQTSSVSSEVRKEVACFNQHLCFWHLSSWLVQQHAAGEIWVVSSCWSVHWIFGILFFTWACPRRKVCCWMWMFHCLFAVRNIWFSRSVIWHCLRCWLQPDPPARPIHVHQQ